MCLVKLIVVLLVALLITTALGCATTNNTTRDPTSLDAPAVYWAAGADTATTSIALHNGARELNPLGFWGATAMKLVYLSRRNSLDADTRTRYDRIATSVWTGAAANNFVQIIAPMPVVYTILVGFMVGYTVYTTGGEVAEPKN
jgi:hypothetical protein